MAWEMYNFKPSNIKGKQKFVKKHNGFRVKISKNIIGRLVFCGENENFFVKKQEVDSNGLYTAFDFSYKDVHTFWLGGDDEDFSSRSFVENVYHPRTRGDYNLMNDFQFHIPSSHSARS